MNSDFQKIWAESTRLVVMEFLRRAIQGDSTLEEVQAALAFDGAQPYLGELRLRDVLQASTVLATKRPRAVAAAAAPAPAARGGRKEKPLKGRGRAARNALKRLVLHVLSENEHGVASGIVGDALRDAGHKTSPMHTYTLLRGLTAAGYVRCEGDQRKVWFITPTGRQKLLSN